MRPRISPDRLALTLGLAASLLLQPGVAAQVAWTSGGPPGGTVTSLAIDPQTPTTLYASLKDHGVFKTTDGGRRWRVVGPSLPNRWISAVAVDPRTPDIVYAARDVFKGESDIFRSADGGKTWRTVSTGLPRRSGITVLAIDPKRPTTLYAGGQGGLFRSSNAGGKWASTSLTEIPITAIAVDPGPAGVIYAGGGDKLFKSADGGGTWRPITSGFPSGASVEAIATDSQNPAAIYAAIQVLGDAFVLKSNDGGQTWRAAQVSTYAHRISSVAIDPRTPTTLYVGALPGEGVFSYTYTTDGVFKSTDGGATWRVIDTDLGNGRVTALVVDPRTPTILYAGTAYSGIFRSANEGERWQTASAGLPGLSSGFLIVDPQTSRIIYAGTSAGLFKSTDGGSAWRAINAGLPTLSIGPFRLDPKTPATLYAGNNGHGLYKSSDGGASWRALSNGLPHRFIRALAIDPRTPSTVYAGGDNSGDDHSFHMRVSVFRSTDGGESWREFKVSDTGAALNALDIDPEDPNTIYATTWVGGIFKSADGGITWHAINNGLRKGSPGFGDEAVSVDLFAIDSRTPRTLYAAQGAAVLKSLDGGRSWNPVFAVPASHRVSILTIDQQTPSTIYIGTQGGGVFRSTDAGQTWSAINTGLTHLVVRALVIDPRTQTILYAGTGGGVFRSIDGGRTWSSLNTGLSDRTVWTLSFDPRSPATLYAGTAGGVFVLRQR